MTSRPVPGAVRAAAIALGALAFIGATLIVVGVLEILWWRSPDAAGLAVIFDRVKQTYGLDRPAMLRGVGGAGVLIAFGVVALGLSGLAWPIRDGHQWARTTAVVGMIGLVVVVGVDIGSDLVLATSPATYTAEVASFDPQGRVVRVEDIQALLYPAWYPWLEDVAQGALVLVCVFALLALGKAAVWSEGYFKAGPDARTDDAWGAKLAKIREENQRRDA
ncbi:hypothetical protein [Allorhizocola rhizosphaerae]|uniref:hypothetical protein n=1 Tax=Allorhizocola rhizosphaerae TaxID=1872709 RepID=UPI0013C37910|nr:hypothetical protein [Allorhizocola rhizosphaerae]